MSEQRYSGGSFAQLKAAIESPEFRAAMRSTGITCAEAAERLHAAAEHFDPAEFEALIATHRPELWKRMNKRPSRLRRMLRWALRRGLR